MKEDRKSTEAQLGLSKSNACFLVKDHSLLDPNTSPVYHWLRDEGFVSWGVKGWFDGVDWVYVNLSSKVYAPGMPGIPLAKAVGNHVITFDEFLQIYDIFKKYDGLDVMQMN